MWLAVRTNITPSAARAWYTHIRAERLKKHLRMFTGHVSEDAVNLKEDLRLEHFLRIQTTLTQLIKNHIENDIYNSKEFIDTIHRCEQVHIVTKKENYEAMKAKGNYDKAGIKLLEWVDLTLEQQQYLWKKMLRGKVANYKEYEPNNKA